MHRKGIFILLFLVLQGESQKYPRYSGKVKGKSTDKKKADDGKSSGGSVYAGGLISHALWNHMNDILNMSSHLDESKIKTRTPDPPLQMNTSVHLHNLPDKVIQELKEAAKEEREEIIERKIFRNNNLTETMGREISCKILILGAGMAGLTAVKTLKSLNVKDIVVVEGGPRVGGRVRDVQFGGVNVEIGANWVHFSNMGRNTSNSVEDMVTRAGLNTVSDNYEDYIYRYKGENVTLEALEAQERFEKAMAGVVKVGDRKRENLEPDIHFRAAMGMQGWKPITPVEGAVEFFNFDFEFGDAPSDTGLIDNFKIFKTHGQDDKFVADKKGYSEIMYKMVQDMELKEGKNLFLNEYVTDINYDEPGNKKIKVISKNSNDGTVNIYRADYVIVTFSIGVLGSGFVQFKPLLPQWKMEILYMYKMIRYIKIYVKFPTHIKPFWDENHYIQYVDPTLRGNYQIWQNLEARGRYLTRGTNMLLVNVIGNNWERVRHLTKEEVKEELFYVLRSMYKEKAVPPSDILIPDWHSNPLFFGAYSNWPIGISEVTYQNLDAPVGRLYFAGEACSPNYSGYLHGAVESGEVTARNLYNCMTSGLCEVVPPVGYGFDRRECKFKK